uniref:VapC9 PIN-like domain-containing protein n=1 Tax=Ignisphaera aggregans TaxID=334771 RepID=A0A7C2VDC7_9CREN
MGSYKDLGNVFDKASCVVILDTSAILLISQNILKFEDVISFVKGCIPVMPRQVLNELEKHASRNGMKGRLASWALENVVPKLQTVEVNVEKCKQDEGDCAIVELSKELSKKVRTIVITADAELKKELMRLGIEVVWYRRAKNKLESATLFS